GDGDTLRDIPVARREVQRQHVGDALGIVAGNHVEEDIIRGLAAQGDVEGSRSAGFGGRAAGGRDNNAGGVVVGVGDRDIGRIHAVINSISADGGGDDDRVADVAVIEEIIHAGDGDRLSN